MCLGNISKYFTIDNINKTGLTGNVQVFSVDTNDVLDIDRYLMKKAYYEVMFTFIKKMFFGLVSTCTIGGFRDLIASDLKELIKCISLNNQRCKTRPAINDINSSETLFYRFTNSVNTCGGSCNTIDDPYA